MSLEKSDASPEEQEYEILKNPEQRDEMRKRALEVVKDIRLKNYSHLVFLDKSARPIQTLLRAVWNQQYPKVPFPHVNFVNIGRETHDKFLEKLVENGKVSSGLEGDGYLKRAAPEGIAELLGPDEIKRIREQYSYLSNAPDYAKVLVIDEYSATGRSLELARKVLDAVFSRRDDPTIPRLDVDTLAFAEAGGTLFRSRQETYTAPWSFENTNPKYGMSGVVDPSSESFTAEASRKMTTEMRMVILNAEQSRHREEIKRAAQSLYENDSLKKIIDGYAKSHSLESTDENRYRHLQELLDTISERYPSIAEQLRTMFAKFFEEKILPCIIEGEAAARELQRGLADVGADSLGARIPDGSLNKLLEVYGRRTVADDDFLRGGSASNDLIYELLVRDEGYNITDDSFYKLGMEALHDFFLILKMSRFREVMAALKTIQSSRRAIEKLEERKEKNIGMGESGRQQMMEKLRKEIKALTSESVPTPEPKERS